MQRTLKLQTAVGFIFTEPNETWGIYKGWTTNRRTKERIQNFNLPDNAVEVCEVGLNLLDGLPE